MENVYILSAKRTPIGRFQGAFKTLTAPQLGAYSVKAAVEAAGISPQLIDEIIFGEVLTAGVGQAPARQTAIAAGLPIGVQALTIGKVCGSGLKSAMLAAQSLALNDAQFIVAGGQESMSNAPYLLAQARDGFRMGNREIIDSMIHDGLWDPYNNIHMGQCAEICVSQYKIQRQQQDNYALESYARAKKSQEAGIFKDEIKSVTLNSGKVQTTIEHDEEPFAADLTKVPNLRPAFEKEGSITAANASKINDGAAALILTNDSGLKTCGAKPLARIVAQASFAHDPKLFTTAPVGAIKKVTEKAKLSVEKIDLFEINEAFAAVPLIAMQELNIPHEKTNIYGGAIALGHPIGASGARVLTTLVHALIRQKLRYGLATLCIGGGEASAVIIERLE